MWDRPVDLLGILPDREIGQLLPCQSLGLLLFLQEDKYEWLGRDSGTLWPRQQSSIFGDLLRWWLRSPLMVFHGEEGMNLSFIYERNKMLLMENWGNVWPWKVAKSKVERTRKKTQTKRERNSQKRLERVIFRRETSKERTMWRLSRRLSIPSVSFVQPRLLPNFIDVNVNKNGEKGRRGRL